MLLLLLACHTVPHDARHTDCATCHAPQVAAWSESRHAVAYSNPIFQHSWAETQDPWCLTCHLPDDGVTCGTCHGLKKQTCADCHEFDLPQALGGAASGTLGQSTVSEWRASGAAAAGTGCIDCHPPHHPAGGHDRGRVRAAVDAAVVARGDTVEAAISVDGIGHAFPTGDPFRRLQLSVCADLTCTQPLARVELERRLERTDDGSWMLDRDTRIPPPADGLRAARSFTLHAPGAVAWELVMHLTDPQHAAELGPRAGYIVATGPVERP
ncbi:MAG: hypothetical protein P8R54_07075 [Myxococcota bacterium]|nr:hypothetical protein [Myxococcota bacterium]